MTINHIDQLTQWWDEAEEGVIEKGDTVINRSDGETTVYVATERARRHHTSARILARAPKPKPAWANARAIIAHTDENPRPSVWTWHKSMERWDDEGGCHWAYTEDLRDVTPLIEARVTGEMVARAMAFWDPNCPGEHDADDIQWAREFITAALGLETA